MFVTAVSILGQGGLVLPSEGDHYEVYGQANSGYGYAATYSDKKKSILRDRTGHLSLPIGQDQPLDYYLFFKPRSTVELSGYLGKVSPEGILDLAS